MKGDESFRRGDYEVHRAREGFSSIRQISSGEIMHSRTDPMEEARQLYVEQARLAERLRERSNEPLILWDVGLGAAANAMAAIECYETAKPRRPLHIISFENDNVERPSWLRRFVTFNRRHRIGGGAEPHVPQNQRFVRALAQPFR